MKIICNWFYYDIIMLYAKKSHHIYSYILVLDTEEQNGWYCLFFNFTVLFWGITPTGVTGVWFILIIALYVASLEAYFHFILQAYCALMAEEEANALSVWAVACLCGSLRLEHVSWCSINLSECGPRTWRQQGTNA